MGFFKIHFQFFFSFFTQCMTTRWLWVPWVSERIICDGVYHSSCPNCALVTYYLPWIPMHRPYHCPRGMREWVEGVERVTMCGRGGFVPREKGRRWNGCAGWFGAGMFPSFLPFPSRSSPTAFPIELMAKIHCGNNKEHSTILIHIISPQHTKRLSTSVTWCASKTWMRISLLLKTY